MIQDQDSRTKQGPKHRKPRKATPDYLRKSALYYLERYSSSAANLRRVMLNKVERSARAHDTDRADGAAAVDALIQNLIMAGLLDDASYAEARARSLCRRGVSSHGIRSHLAGKGVSGDAVERALAKLREESAEPELAAALIYARKRRLGPYRVSTKDQGTEDQETDRERALAALGRRGFSYDLARRIIEANSATELEQEAGIAGRLL